MNLIKKLLIVDDDKEILENLESILKQRHNINTTTLNSSDQVIKHLKHNIYDGIVLDLMLPGIDGHMLCREIRKMSDVPLIMVSALHDVSERLLAYELGADDFLVKPFNANELIARLEIILKRSNSTKADTLKHTVYRFSGWTLNTAIFKLTSPDNVEVALSSSDYKLLVAFLDHPNRILSRDYLVEYMQNRSRDVFDRSIDVRVSLLRKKLQAPKHPNLIKDIDKHKSKSQHEDESEETDEDHESKHPSLIETIHNQGYILTAKVDKESV